MHFLTEPTLTINGLLPFAGSDFGAFDRDVLTVARHFFESHEQPEAFAWKHAFEHAETAFSAPFGATIAHVTSKMVDALIAARSRTFSYLPVHHVMSQSAMTREEHYFLSAIHDIRMNRMARARTHAMLLCEGGACDPFVFAAQSLGIITGEVEA